MDYLTLIVISLVGGLFTGILSRFDYFQPIVWLLGLGEIITLFSYALFVMNFSNNPSIDGLYSFVYSVIPFVISAAFSARGEEIVESLTSRN